MRIGLFIPCYIDAFFPDVGIATLELLERFGHDVDYPQDQTCCGQPMANSGFNAEAADTAALFVRNFSAIVHFYNTRDFLPRCQPHDVGEGTTCWPAPESTDNMNTSRVGHLGLSDAEEDAIVSFMQTLTDGFMPRDQR